MKKFILFFFLGLILLPLKSFSQFDSNGVCSCNLPLDTLIYQQVQFTLGPDSVYPPYYYNNMNTSQAIKLPFKFCFYGTNYDTIYIGNKGNISFIKPIYRFTTGNFPAGKDTAMIAPFWADICNIPYGPHPLGIGQVWYKISPTNLIVQWVESGYYHFDDDLYNSFQLIITNGSDPIIPGGNNVEFCYLINGMEWASSDSSGGTNGFNGVPATVGINKGDSKGYAVIARFGLPGLTFYGPTSAINGLYWLNNKSLTLNTRVTEKNIPPVIIGSTECDTLTVCRWDSIQYTVNFLCPEQGQKATISSPGDSLGGIHIDTSSGTNGIYTVNIKAAINNSSLGFHTINIKATDNSIPPQTSTFPIVVNVNICDGINETSKNTNGFTLYPNANNGIFTVQLNNEEVPDNTKILIYDMLGKVIYSSGLNNFKTSIDISGISKGMYFLKIFSGENLLGIKKIVIQ